MRLPIGEIVLPTGKRAEGSASKLRSVGDGWRILRTFVDDENGGVCHAHLNAWSRDLKRRFRRYG
jgi:hypothetical protein